MGSSWLAVALAAAVVFAACGGGGPPPLRAADFARNCGANSDCMPMADATTCQCPLCDNRAIRVSDAQAYAAALQKYEQACQGTPCSNVVCPNVVAYCDNGTCEVK